MKVLVVDDSATIRHHLIELLSTLPGVETLEAAQASEARHTIRSWAAGRRGAMDIHMPKGSGLEDLERWGQIIDSPHKWVGDERGDGQVARRCPFRAGPTFFDRTAEFQQGHRRHRTSGARSCRDPFADDGRDSRCGRSARRPEFLARGLTSAGHSVTEASNAAAGLRVGHVPWPPPKFAIATSLQPSICWERAGPARYSGRARSVMRAPICTR